MQLVVNVLVAACWLLHDESHPIANAAEEVTAADSVIVPMQFWFEIRNLLIVNERRERLDAAMTARALRFVRALPLAVDHDAEEDALMRLARTHRLTAYDAAYLELASLGRVPLATLDAALTKAARSEAASTAV